MTLALGLSASAWPLLQRLQQMERIKAIALTPGAATTLKDMPADLRIGPASQLLKANWTRGGNLLVIGAIGAVTRLIAPLVQDKHSDPAVVVMDARGEHVVPLLGGHSAGAEQLARDPVSYTHLTLPTTHCV